MKPITTILTETNLTGETHCHQCGHMWKENPNEHPCMDHRG